MITSTIQFISKMFGEQTSDDLADKILQKSKAQLVEFETAEVYNRKMAEYCRENIERLSQ